MKIQWDRQILVSIESKMWRSLFVAGAVSFLLLAPDRVSGQNWHTIPTDAPMADWHCIASSADGTKLAAAVGGYNAWGQIYLSTNSGLHWTQANSPVESWASIASSLDGVRLVAAAGGTEEAAPVYCSSNSGVTWTVTSAPRENWASVACSEDGTRLVAASFGNFSDIPGHIYTSIDSGLTWISNNAPALSWSVVASSADGTRLVAAASGHNQNGPIFTSTDSGATWVETSAPVTNWACLVFGRRHEACCRSGRGDGRQRRAGLCFHRFRRYVVHASPGPGSLVCCRLFGRWIQDCRHDLRGLRGTAADAATFRQTPARVGTRPAWSMMIG